MPILEAQDPDVDSCELNEVPKGRLLATGSLSNAALASGGVLPALCLVQISEQFQLSDAQCGLFLALGPTVTLVSLPLFGQLSERWGKRPILFLGLLLLVAAMACYRSADQYSILLMGSLAIGLSCSIIDALISPLLIDLYPHEEGDSNASLMNLVHSCFQIGVVGTALTAGIYLARGGVWTDTFLPVMLLSAVLAFLYAITRFPPPMSIPRRYASEGFSRKSLFGCAR